MDRTSLPNRLHPHVRCLLIRCRAHSTSAESPPRVFACLRVVRAECRRNTKSDLLRSCLHFPKSDRSISTRRNLRADHVRPRCEESEVSWFLSEFPGADRLWYSAVN